MRCTPIRCMPMKCISNEMHARKMHAREVHARETHAYEIHARGIHAREVRVNHKRTKFAKIRVFSLRDKRSLSAPRTRTPHTYCIVRICGFLVVVGISLGAKCALAVLSLSATAGRR